MAVAPKDNELHRIAVTGIIWKLEGGVRKYLITKRAPHKTWGGKWTVPGGGLEQKDYRDTPPTHDGGESPQWYGVLEKTVRREIREETNLEVKEVEYLLDIIAVRPSGNPVLILSMYSEYASGEVALDAEATEYAWITADEVGKYDLIHGIDDEIRQVEKRLAAKK